MSNKKLSDIAFDYCIQHDLDELWTDNICVLHEIYDNYKANSKYYKPLKNEHPLNKLRAVRSALHKDDRFEKIGWFNSCWGRVTGFKIIKETSNA